MAMGLIPLWTEMMEKCFWLKAGSITRCADEVMVVPVQSNCCKIPACAAASRQLVIPFRAKVPLKSEYLNVALH